MLYLEDYLEMIEHLPQELKDRFTEIRELDLQVQNTSDKLDDRVKNFFSGAKRMKFADREVEFDVIRKEYYKALEDADEKVHQATDLYNLVERYLRRLDQELHKFKMELEADNAGITEVLERRSREVEQQSFRERDRDTMLSQKENRFLLPTATKPEKKERKVSVEKSGGGSEPGTPNPASGISLGNIGVAGNAIAAAASQAIAATQRMQEGRRTASFRTSYEAINMGLQGQEFSVGIDLLAKAELHEAARQAMSATSSNGEKEQKRNKRKSQHTQNHDLMQVPEDFLEDPVIAPLETPEWAYDPSEPRYCLCNQVSYGDMVACDNEDCPIEWFHYPCVGITATPKGKWYCPQCSSSLKRRGRR